MESFAGRPPVNETGWTNSSAKHLTEQQPESGLICEVFGQSRSYTSIPVESEARWTVGKGRLPFPLLLQDSHARKDRHF